MALRSMSPRITGALAGFAMLSACGSYPPALTSPSQPTSAFKTQQCAIPTVAAGNLVPFSYFGLGAGGCGFGAYGIGRAGLGVLGGPWDLFGPSLVPLKAGAIGSALPFDPVGYAGIGAWGMPFGYGSFGLGGFGGIAGAPIQQPIGQLAQPIQQSSLIQGNLPARVQVSQQSLGLAQ